MDPRRRAWALLVALGVAATTAVLGVMLAGPVRVEPRSWTPPSFTDAPTPPAVTPLARPQVPEAWQQGAQTVGSALAVIVGVLVAVILAVIVFALIRRRGLPRFRLDRRPADPVLPGLDRETEAAVAPAVVERGLRRALRILDGSRDPGDAVIAAWLGLEDAASTGGAPRRPSETPSEYTARIIRRFDTDEAAADRLRRLYERVRFGGGSSDPGSVAVARDCLTRLLDSWRDEHAEERAEAAP